LVLDIESRNKIIRQLFPFLLIYSFYLERLFSRLLVFILTHKFYRVFALHIFRNVKQGIKTAYFVCYFIATCFFAIRMIYLAA